MNKNPVINHNDLAAFAAALLQAGGFTAEEARITAQSLVLSNLMGHDSHGVMRVSDYLYFLKTGEAVSGATLKIIRETPSSIHADGQRGLGQVQMPRLLGKLIEKAQTQGTAAGAMKNCGHAGRLGEWVEVIAANGMAGFVAVNDNGTLFLTAPPGGKEGRTSTNPLAFGIPLPEGKIFSLDMATSAIAVGKVRVARLAGKQCPPGCLQDSEGRPTTDPAVMFEDPKGALLPFGGEQGYKGFALSMMVDCLTAGLSGGFTPPAPDGEPETNNVVISIWNPESFSGLAHMQDQAQKYIDFVKAATPTDPGKPVRVAGERAWTEKEKRIKDGIPLDPSLTEKLVKKAEKLGVDVPKCLKSL